MAKARNKLCNCDGRVEVRITHFPANESHKKQSIGEAIEASNIEYGSQYCHSSDFVNYDALDILLVE